MTYLVGVLVQVVLEPAGRGFVVSVPALPEARAEGDTVDEALANAHTVIEICLDARRDDLARETLSPSEVRERLLLAQARVQERLGDVTDEQIDAAARRVRDARRARRPGGEAERARSRSGGV